MSDSEFTNLAAIFQPHNDDAVIAIGGILQKLLKGKWNLHYVYMTDSRHGGNESPEVIGTKRSQEAACERNLLGIANFTEFGYVDQSLSTLSGQQRDDVIGRIAQWLASSSPHVIFVPSRGEQHPDHIATHDLVLMAFDRVKPKSIIVKYSVWLMPDFYLKSSDVADQVLLIGIDDEEKLKNKLIKCHSSQLRRLRYDIAIRHLNKYNARILKADSRIGCLSAEIIGLYRLNGQGIVYKKLLGTLLPYLDVTTVVHGRSS
ncbi:MAG: hypothetical protein COW33_00705 [Anaerolineae bacterium CG17_big_fil_post_rev_8_21_14_2_50_57_27]|nr:MAG: hypothetical protein COW33_00705 [Anaerolineae bacterium CG17_big_fil_post_rev_8_21_14_2_50_57_27]